MSTAKLVATIVITIATAMVIVSCKTEDTYMNKAPDVDKYGAPTGTYDYYRDSKKSYIAQHGYSRGTIKKGARFLYIESIDQLGLIIPKEVGKRIPGHKISITVSSSCGRKVFADCLWKVDLDQGSVFQVESPAKNEIIRSLAQCVTVDLRVFTKDGLFRVYHF